MTSKLPRLFSTTGVKASVLLIGTAEKNITYTNKYNIKVKETSKMNHQEIVKSIEGVINPVLMLISDDSGIAKLGHPTKLFEYLSFGLPTIVSVPYAQLVNEKWITAIERNNDNWVDSFFEELSKNSWPKHKN